MLALPSGVHRASCSRGGFHNRVWVSIQGQCQIALSRPAQLDESCHGRSLAMAHVLSLVCSLRVVKPPSQDTSAAVDRDSLLRSANRRRQWAADVPCAQSRHRPVGLADGKVRQLASGGTHEEWPRVSVAKGIKELCMHSIAQSLQLTHHRLTHHLMNRHRSHSHHHQRRFASAQMPAVTLFRFVKSLSSDCSKQARSHE